MDKVIVKMKVGRTKDGRIYHMLVADVGYRAVKLTYDEQDIAEILCISVAELYSKYPVKEGERVSFYE